jgi:hypothetical protein
MTTAFQGIGTSTSRSLALGPAFVDGRGGLTVSQSDIAADQVAAEIERLDLAVMAARQALKAVRDQIPHHTPLNIAEFIDTHLLMLEDAALVEEVRRIVAEQLCNAEWALQRQRDTLVRVFDEMTTPICVPAATTSSMSSSRFKPSCRAQSSKASHRRGISRAGSWWRATSHPRMRSYCAIAVRSHS